jgi:glycine/D-amino acid oxidase-like deaminating enzyme
VETLYDAPIVRANALPADDPGCGWYATLPPPAPARTLEGEQRADWAVLGAGFTGLAAARQLARHRPEARVVVLDAQRVGMGAAGRNSGFVVSSPHYHATADAEENRRTARLNRAGLDLLREQVVEHDVRCDWRESGHVQVAVGARGEAALEHHCGLLDEVGDCYERLGTDAIAKLTGSEYYSAGARVAGTALMQPAALVRGLAEALPPSVEVFEESPVVGRELGDAIRLDCPAGSLTARHLLVACNAFAPALGFVAGRVFPLLTFSSLTRRLTDAEQRKLGGEPAWGLLPAERMGTTVRRTVDGRILIRNSVRYAWSPRVRDGLKRRMRSIHADSFRARFPALGDPDFEYTWGGVICLSLNAATFFGRVAPRVYASLCYNGAGVARGTIAGTLLADLAVGADSAPLREIQQSPGPSRLPPDPLRGLGVGLATRFWQWRAGEER